MPVINITSEGDMSDSIQRVNKHLANGQRKSFVLIYRNGCPPCMNTKPKWHQLKNSEFGEEDDIGIFDIEESMLDNIKHSGLKKNISGVPTMRYVHGNVCEDYEDCHEITKDRSFESFLKWIKHKTAERNMSMGMGMRGGARKTRKNQSSRRRKGKSRWSLKYKRTINCRRPRGFSQRQYCKYGRAKKRRG